MEVEKAEKCLTPRINNFWERKKNYFEIAAVQSSVGKVNPDLPDALLAPLITVLDPCTIHSSIHAKVDWNLVASRLKRLNILSRQTRGVASLNRPSGSQNLDGASDIEGSSDGGSSPAFHQRKRGNSRGIEGAGEPMEVEMTEEMMLKKDKDTFIDEIVDLVRDIQKHNDASMSSQPTWIDRLSVEKISNQILMLQNYLPSLLTVEEIINALLFEHGPDVIENLIIETPENLVTIVNILTNNPTPGNRTRYRNLVIGKIVELYPYFARRIIEKYSEKRSDCVFACRLAVDHLNDRQFLEFMEPLLTDKETIIYKMVIRSSNRQVLPLIIARLLNMADTVISPRPESTSFSEMGTAPWCTRLSYCLVELMNSALEPWTELEIITVTRFLFRTDANPSSSILHSADSISGMDEAMDLSFREEAHCSQDSVVPDSDPESTQSAQRPIPVSQRTAVEPSPFGDAHECFVLSALLAVPFFTQYPPNQTGAVQPPDRAVENWLDVSRRRVLAGEKVTSAFGSHLIYVHSCIMSSRIEELSEFASYGMKQKVELVNRQNHVLVLKNTFTSRCMTEMEVAKRSICQLVTKCSNGESSYALRTIHALQAAGVYKTFQINIRSWLEEQLDNITLPASQLLAEVVDGFAHSSAHSKGKGLSEEFIKNTFTGDVFDSRTIPKRLFVLFYICSYREAAQRHDASLRNSLYDKSIFLKLPVRYILSVMEYQHEKFENVRSKITARAAVLFSYSLPTPESMQIVAENHENASAEVIEEEQFGSNINQRINKLKDIKNIKIILEVINRSSVRMQLASLPIIIDIFMESLNSSTPQGFEQPLMAIFDRYEQLDPFSLFQQSTIAWIRNDEDIVLDDIIKIPSLLFRCDRRILSSPPHFNCFVRALNFFSKMVRIENRLKTMEIQHKAMASAIAHKNTLYCLELDRKEKELLTGSYLDTQHSVLIHALIEVCDSKRMKDDPSDFSLLEKRRQIRRIACEYIHRTFLDYEGLIRVVLHQRFPLRQVRDLVEGIPALFAGNGLILEMLTLPEQQRRFFAVVFAAEICRKYRVRESLETARVVCDIVHSLHKHGELPSSYKLWKHVAPALMLLAVEFPSLADSINRLLTRVATAAKNRLAVRCGMLAGDPRHEEYQLIAKISSFLDRNSARERL
ncbi:INTegrator complex Subunit homolog [Caenorhabditis elegans]|uniref:INTegrator complex Subunit homolog n=1 Tax=Caenorhabditis elegans TaxID=6239 RepID=Q23271_CAEEL|nr:INTegrator complex Subunit homolog [Caenorhabditis elegans]CAB00882.1 INTegrator complex Subunit homolog [Caenorhabditis elegans]|eukprot:NP_001256570.1 Uncharacterized protein CELE_ZC376.6 [Caenorhabditis elegans]